MLLVFVTVVHFIVALVLIGVVLLQTGKRADLAGAFGGGGSQTALGTRGAATFLSKMTTFAAVLFMCTSLSLSILSSSSSGESGSVLDRTSAPVEESTAPGGSEQAPAEPAGLPPLDGGESDAGAETDTSETESFPQDQ